MSQTYVGSKYMNLITIKTWQEEGTELLGSCKEVGCADRPLRVFSPSLQTNTGVISGYDLFILRCSQFIIYPYMY